MGFYDILWVSRFFSGEVDGSNLSKAHLAKDFSVLSHVLVEMPRLSGWPRGSLALGGGLLSDRSLVQNM